MIKFNLCGSKEIRKDLDNLVEFKERWFQLISGWQTIDRDEDLERSQAIFTAILIFENLLTALEEEEKEQEAKKFLKIKN